MPGAEVLVGARLAALSTQTPADDHNNNDDSYDEDGEYKMKDIPQDERQKGKTERAMEKTAATTTKREAPESIKRIYRDVTPHVLQLLKDPANTGAQQEVMKAQKLITKYYDDLQEPVKREEQFDIILSLLVHAGKMRNKLPKNADGRQRQSYEAMALILEKTAAHFDWPKDWRFAKRSV
ncbi:hypothetical protein GB937_009243 [Aspergillus fischeri]|nr:hypothetical protein GB937_009243 [Aspergillus fischeri]